MKKLYGLIGFPLGHSFSSQYHNDRFRRDNIDARYDNYELSDISLLPSLVKQQPMLMGLNVTIPHKENVLPYLDEVDDVAQRIGAVNVIKIIRNDSGVRMVGYNSDYAGFRNSIESLLLPHHTHALVLGSGGASKAVSTALRDMGLSVKIVSRTPRCGELSYGELTDEIMSQYTVIINATPVGMHPHVDACVAIPYDKITSRHLCYDVVYNPSMTLFMSKSAAQGAVVSNGLSMLHGQADIAWKIWNNE